MADAVFPGSPFNRPLLADYLSARAAAACDRALALSRETVQADGDSAAAAADLVESFEVVPIELGEPEAVDPKRVFRTTGDPTRGTPWNRDPKLPHDHYCVKRRIVNGDPELLRQWPNTAGLHDVSLTSYDSTFVYVTWDVPVGEDPSVWAALASEQMDRLDAVLGASRAVIEAWRSDIRRAVDAAVNRRMAMLSAADRAYSSLGAKPAVPSNEEAPIHEGDDS